MRSGLAVGSGARVGLLDKSSFPRDKLCGEFLSPECAGVLDDLGLAPALRWYANRQAKRNGWTLSLSVEGMARRVPVPIEVACFRIAQEALGTHEVTLRNGTVTMSNATNFINQFDAIRQDLGNNIDGLDYDMEATSFTTQQA